MSDLARALAGKFIVLDGPDGSGKTTQLGLLRDHLLARAAEVECARDPGGTAVGDKIRQILLDRENGKIAPMCETLLFMASRAQLVAERIRPALAAGKVVLCDRFISATVAYQGASGVDRKTIVELGHVAVQGIWPDLTVILDVEVEIGMERLGAPRQRLKRAAQGGPRQASLFGDRLEAVDLSYHDQVRKIFRGLGKYYPGQTAYVDAGQAPEGVFKEVLAAIERAFGG